jgi:ribonuclease VapC
MSEAVLDASALLALLLHEPGSEKLTDEILERSIASTVNLAEAQSRLVRGGYDPGEAWEDVLALVNEAEPLSLEQAEVAGNLIAKTQSHGLSLGDRCCLALAIARKADVYTTERIWKNLKLGVRIHVIR